MTNHINSKHSGFVAHPQPLDAVAVPTDAMDTFNEPPAYSSPSNTAVPIHFSTWADSGQSQLSFPETFERQDAACQGMQEEIMRLQKERARIVSTLERQDIQIGSLGVALQNRQEWLRSGNDGA